MNKLLFTLPLLAILLLASCSQNLNGDRLLPQIKTPDAVLSSFKAYYPNATGISWRSSTEFHDAFFLSDGSEHGARFVPVGDLNLGWSKIRLTELPIAAQEYLVTYYSTFEFASARVITDFTVSKSDLKYEAMFVQKDREAVVLFDAEGEFVKVSVEDGANHDGCGD